MRVLAVLLLVAGLVLAIAPQYTNCEARQGTMAGASTASSPAMGAAAAPVAPKMKCLWSARASLAVGIPLMGVGVLLFFSRRRETRRALGVTGGLLGLMAVLLPTSLIGVCASSAAVCNTTMRPLMLSAGGLAIAASVIAIMVNELGSERVTPSGPGG